VRALWLIIETALALALQTTLDRFVKGQLVVDLVLVVVVYTALTSGSVAGLLAGTFAGLVQDAMSTGILGMGGLANTIVGFLAGVIGTQFIVAHAFSRFVVFALATVLHAAIFMGLYQGLGLRDFGSPYRAVLEQALGNALVGVLAFQVVEMLPGAVERRRSRPRR
jgi:rod shape-determining protein MreD